MCFPAFSESDSRDIGKKSNAPEIAVESRVEPEIGTAEFIISGTSRLVSLRVQKDRQVYFYKTEPDCLLTVPLNMGDGRYVFTVFIHETANWGRDVWSQEEHVTLGNEFLPYLNASQIVNWSPDMALVDTARELSKNKTQEEAALIFCDYIAKQYRDGSNPAAPNYIPDLEKIYQSKEGICYDMAAMYAAMCRSVGIPCKLVMGYSEYIGSGKYHAWGSVYVDGAWRDIDPNYSRVYGTSFLDAKYTSVTYVY